MKYVLDTNIITALLKGNEKIKNRIRATILKGNEIVIHGICYYEIKRGLLAADAVSQLERFEKFVNKFKLLLLDRKTFLDEAAEIYASLKKKGKLISDADILIAAPCRNSEYVIITDDVKHFQRIENITVENWLD